jgi:hypothetical protein
MRAKVDDFMYVLLAGIVILIIALAYFASIPPGGIGLEVPVAELSVGSVGFTGDNMISRSYGSFQVGLVNKETIKSTPQIQVSSSYFGAKAEKQEVRILNAYVPLAREAVLSFRVYDSTPYYGNLIIKWNGKELYKDGAEKGVYNLHIEKQYIREINNLEISCDGPGLQFWASTAYILRDFKIVLDYGSMKLIPFTLSSENLETFKNGALEFSPSGTGNLIIKVNGAQVYSGIPENKESVKFDLFNAGISPGNNIIALSAPAGTITLNNVVLKIFLSTDQVARELNFDLTAANYSLFLQGYRGRIDMQVLGMMKQGAMSITLNGKELSVPPLKKGTNTIYFSNQEALEGTNTLVFSSSGGWDVGTASIVLER